MAYNDLFRLSAHAVMTDQEGRVLQLKAAYGEKNWGLPGGSLEPTETIHEALIRECREELGVDIQILYMSGMYFHKIYHSHACIFRCEILKNNKIKLSDEHCEYRYFYLDELTDVQRKRVQDCLQFNGQVKSAKF